MPIPDSASAPASGRILAEVVLLTPAKSLSRLSYEVPPNLIAQVAPGQRVLVPLRGRQLTALVVQVTPDIGLVPGLKPLREVLDPQPLLDAAHLKLLDFMATYYLAPLSEVYRCVMPGSLRVQTRVNFALLGEPNPIQAAGLTAAERAVLARLARAPMTAGQLTRALGAEAANALRTLVEQGLIEPRQAMRGRHRDARPMVARLVEADPPTPRGARHKAIMKELSTGPAEGLALEALEAKVPGARAALPAMAARGWITLVPLRAAAPPPPERQVTLTTEQEAAVATVMKPLAARRFETFLLWGITASGKTEVYLRLAEQCLAVQRQVLVLVPEIALTDHLVEAFRRRFGALATVAHSGQNITERWAAWNASLSGQARILVGPRSALFAPMHDLGLIVVDEEHDPAYKQEEAIRYHARDLAVALASFSRCPVVLGSATPSAESFANARAGRYRMLQMRRRIHDRPLAAVEIVDLRRLLKPPPPPASVEEEDRPPPPVPLSERLLDALRNTLKAGGQSLVFVNRRGYHSFLHCRLCGNVLSCPDCSVSMTFHLRDRSLRCHYCGHYVSAPDRCPECRGVGLQGQGFGTERLAASLQELLPEARIERMDSDTSRRHGARARILTALARGQLDILVGTQMITKGFDFPGVTLVGVVLADMSLNLPDFRSAERTFQLLTQAAGRAGRGEQPGRVIIQTYAPHHYSIRAAEHQDYLRFMRRELDLRRELDYPPFGRLALIRLEGGDAHQVETLALKTAAVLERLKGNEPRMRVLGPAPAPIERIKQRYRWQLMIKAPTWSQMRAILSDARAAMTVSAEQNGVQFTIDVDPVHML